MIASQYAHLARVSILSVARISGCRHGDGLAAPDV